MLAVSLFAASCSDKDDVEIPGGLALDKEEIVVSPEGGNEQVAVSASQDWVASVDDPWLMLSPANGVGSTTGSIKVDSTLMNGRRISDITFLGSNGQRRTLSVVQFGYGK